MTVTETFFAVTVRDMERATAFYTRAFGATVAAATPVWTSLRIAGVRVGLFAQREHAGGYTGLHFAVDDLAAACAEVAAAGGRVVEPPSQAGGGVVLAVVADSEDNVITLRG